MITWLDLNPKGFEVTTNQESNLRDMAKGLTELEVEFLKSPGSFLFTITSGFRSMAEHNRIYRVKGIDHPPLGSRHLTGQASDVSDPHGILKAWCGTEDNPNPTLVRLGFYCEKNTTNWMHFQKVAPASGHRFFLS